MAAARDVALLLLEEEDGEGDGLLAAEGPYEAVTAEAGERKRSYRAAPATHAAAKSAVSTKRVVVSAAVKGQNSPSWVPPVAQLEASKVKGDGLRTQKAGSAPHSAALLWTSKLAPMAKLKPVRLPIYQAGGRLKGGGARLDARECGGRGDLQARSYKNDEWPFQPPSPPLPKQ